MKDITRHLKTQPKVRVFAPNHNIICTSYGEYFISYNSTVAFLPNDSSMLYLGPNWNYSRTTSKHLNRYLNTDSATLRKRLADGTAQIVEM